MFRVTLSTLAATSWLLACGGGGSAECGAAECADVCARAEGDPARTDAAAPKPAEVPLSAFEHSLVDPMVAAIREGIRPRDASSVGICKGASRECAEFVGLDAKELPAGEYSIHAHLLVPAVGPKGTWKVAFVSSCDTIRVKDDGTEVRTSQQGKERQFDVVHGGEGSVYSLAPLRRIESPSKNGRQECTYTLRLLHPDSPTEIKGSWSVPEGS